MQMTIPSHVWFSINNTKAFDRNDRIAFWGYGDYWQWWDNNDVVWGMPEDYLIPSYI